MPERCLRRTNGRAHLDTAPDGESAGARLCAEHQPHRLPRLLRLVCDTAALLLCIFHAATAFAAETMKLPSPQASARHQAPNLNRLRQGRETNVRLPRQALLCVLPNSVLPVHRVLSTEMGRIQRRISFFPGPGFQACWGRHHTRDARPETFCPAPPVLVVAQDWRRLVLEASLTFSSTEISEEPSSQRQPVVGWGN